MGGGRGGLRRLVSWGGGRLLSGGLGCGMSGDRPARGRVGVGLGSGLGGSPWVSGVRRGISAL